LIVHNASGHLLRKKLNEKPVRNYAKRTAPGQINDRATRKHKMRRGSDVSRLTDLIARAKAKDPALGGELEREFKALASRRAFGLNFERHKPESVELPGRPIRRGDKVHVLPPRGSTAKGDQRLWRVLRLEGRGAARVAHLTLIDAAEPETAEVPITDLVVAAEFRDYIYPGLVSTGKVERGGNKPFHTVINGENFHSLEALTYTHRGKIDAIYIDPPYNSGAKDWKYNNDYVESEDLYRHSKWLAFIERRLMISRELLNPVSSTLIVTIDEKEYLRLGLLLEQIFPDATIQMISSVINPKGSARSGRFSRVDEYIYFVFLGVAAVTPWRSDMLREVEGEGRKVRWAGLMRNGEGSRRQRIPSTRKLECIIRLESHLQLKFSPRMCHLLPVHYRSGQSIKAVRNLCGA
jgi:adenine-specific DNA-methyltransferase